VEEQLSARVTFPDPGKIVELVIGDEVSTDEEVRVGGAVSRIQLYDLQPGPDLVTASTWSW
jgi:hypothetical protein